MQRGYFSLLLEDYFPQVYSDQKYVYSSLVERLSNQEQVVGHLKFAFKQVTNYCYSSMPSMTFQQDYNKQCVHLIALSYLLASL